MKISFIIVNYRSRIYLKKCIQSIVVSVKNIDFEVFVVNNDKKTLATNSFGFLKNDYHKKLKIIEINKNIGFGKGCNIGAKKAEGDILCFLNPDTEIVSKDIKIILDVFEDDKVGIVGGRIITKNGKNQKWTSGESVGLWKIIKNNFGFVGDEKIWQSNEKREVSWITGANLFIKKNIFDKVNGFDERFFLYFEDVDICKRVQSMGCRIIYFPKFVVKHIGGGSAISQKKQKKEYYKSQDYFFKKWFGIFHFLALIMIRKIVNFLNCQSRN